MITAETAYNRTTENSRLISNKELEKIKRQIDDAISKGQYSMSYSGSLSENTLYTLKSLGYKAINGCQYNDPYYIVSWYDSE